MEVSRRNETIEIEKDEERLMQRGAEVFLQAARASFEARGSFAVAISGGSTPRAMHRLLARDPFVSLIPWERTHIFWVDERCVPREDPSSNYGAALRPRRTV